MSSSLVALALPVGLNILNLLPSVASSHEHPTMDSRNKYKVHIYVCSCTSFLSIDAFQETNCVCVCVCVVAGHP